MNRKEFKDATRCIACWWLAMALLLTAGGWLMIHCPQTTDAIGAWLDGWL